MSLADGSTRDDREREMPPAPDRAVATLLLGLMATEGRWISRAEAARRLYPDSDPAAARNALRQALYRLRRWLGREVTESRSGGLRLIPEVASFVGETAWDGGMPWPDHPWADEIRDACGPSPSLSHFEDLARAVESAAEVDRDAARRILVGGSALVLNMAGDAAGRLMALTRPEDDRAPLAFEHLDLWGNLRLDAFAFVEAEEAYRRAYRIALGRRNVAKAIRAASMSAFVRIEAGDMAKAAVWLDRCEGADGGEASAILLANARAALLWNSGRVAEALESMRRAIPLPDDSRAPHRLHYWTNLAALASEAGDPELAIRADEAARRIVSPSVHLTSLFTLEFACATRLMGRGAVDESLRAFESLRRSVARSGPVANRAYADEGYAEALSRAGEVRQAVSVWSDAEARRRSVDSRLTPRLANRKSRILRAV